MITVKMVSSTAGTIRFTNLKKNLLSGCNIIVSKAARINGIKKKAPCLRIMYPNTITIKIWANLKTVNDLFSMVY